MRGKRRECRKRKVWRSGFGVLERMKWEIELMCVMIPVFRLASLGVPTCMEALQGLRWACTLLNQWALLRAGGARVQHWLLLFVPFYGSEGSGVKHNLSFSWIPHLFVDLLLFLMIYSLSAHGRGRLAERGISKIFQEFQRGDRFQIRVKPGSAIK